MSDVRSKSCVFVSHCVLAQGIMADGLVRVHAAAIKPVLQFCLDHDINVMQMPCPETLCGAGGLGREPHGKAWYEKHGLRATAKAIAVGQADYMAQLTAAGFAVLAVVGVEFSPACAVNYLNQGRRLVRDNGIYIEELQAALRGRGLEVKFIGVSPRWHNKMVADLTALIEPELKGL